MTSSDFVAQEGQSTNPSPATLTARAVIERIAKVAEGIGFHAGVGGCETAGAIVSFLAANPDRIAVFLEDGFLDALEMPNGHPRDMHLNGCLTWHRRDGRVVSPAEARAARDARTTENMT